MSQMVNADLLRFDLQDRLAKAMRVRGVSSTQLAAELGVHRNTIANYLGARSEPDRRTLMAWAMACGVPLEWLEYGVMPGDDRTPPAGWAPRGSNPEPAVYELRPRLARAS